MNKLFYVNAPVTKVYRPRHVVIDLLSVPSDAFELYLSGFRYLSPTPEAADLFRNVPPEKMQSLIALKRTEGKDDEALLLESFIVPEKPKSEAKPKK